MRDYLVIRLELCVRLQYVLPCVWFPRAQLPTPAYYLSSCYWLLLPIARHRRALYQANCDRMALIWLQRIVKQHAGAAEGSTVGTAH